MKAPSGGLAARLLSSQGPYGPWPTPVPLPAAPRTGGPSDERLVALIRGFSPAGLRELRRLAGLLRLRDPGDRSLRVMTLHVGMAEDAAAPPERFFCASERMAMIPIPSLTSHEAFDCGIATAAEATGRLLDHGRQVYASALKIETPEDAAELDVRREGDRRP